MPSSFFVPFLSIICGFAARETIYNNIEKEWLVCSIQCCNMNRALKVS